MASRRLSKRELHLKEVEELNRQFRRASFDRRNKEDAAGRAARRSESHDEGPDPSRESNCNLHSKVACIAAAELHKSEPKLVKIVCTRFCVHMIK